MGSGIEGVSSLQDRRYFIFYLFFLFIFFFAFQASAKTGYSFIFMANTKLLAVA